MTQESALIFAISGGELPELFARWLARLSLPVLTLSSSDELMAIGLRGRPRLVVFDARSEVSATLAACRRFKRDSYTGIVPCVVTCADDRLGDAFDAGADEVIPTGMAEPQAIQRLEALLRRSDRDVHVHPSTRLPGTTEIEAEIARRLALEEKFAVCYADLDHFKEFNDRYSYADGDRVIRILAQILHDVTKGLCLDDGFVGHIGGDDFIVIIPATAVAEVCTEVIAIFDTIVPYQYSEQDRRVGYFFGKDRRDQLHRVPLMTLSIGVITNERRHFTSAAQVSELATEMKSYAKTLPGSVYSVDRRQDPYVGAPDGPPPPLARAAIRVGGEA